MNKTQKKLLARLMAVTNSLGGTLDGTATCEQKYIDRQRAHRLSYKVIYGLFGDNPNNPYREDDINNAKNIAEIMNNAGFDVEYMEMDLSSRESIKSIIKKHKNMEILQCL